MSWADNVIEESGTLQAQNLGAAVCADEVAQMCYVAHELTDTKPEERLHAKRAKIAQTRSAKG